MTTARLTSKLRAITRRELGDRTLTPGEAQTLSELCDVSADVLDWLTRMGYTNASNIVWNLRRKLDALDE